MSHAFRDKIAPLMVKKSLVWLYSFSTILLWLVIIVLGSSVLTLRYVVLPHIKDYKEKIAAEASVQAEQKITIGDIRASWDGMSPHLDLYKVDVYDAQDRVALHLDRVEASLSWLSIPLLEPHLAKLVIHEPNLQIRRMPDGDILVAGISINAPGESTLPNWLIRQSSILMENASIVWQDDLRQAPPLTLSNVTLNFSTPTFGGLLGHHQFGLRATTLAGATLPIDLRGDVWGTDVDHLENWRGTLYAELHGVNVATWRAWLDYPFELQQGTGATRFWLDFAAGAVNRVTTDVLLADVHTRLGADLPETGLKHLAGRLAWRKLGDGDEIKGERLRFTTNEGFSLDNASASVGIHTKDGKETIQGEAKLAELDLHAFASFAAHLPLGTDMQQKLAALSPRGKLQQVAFSWTGNRQALQQYQVRGRFSELGLGSVQGNPAFSGISGRLDATEKGGRLDIDAHHASLDLKGALRWPIPAERLTGKVTWENKPEVVEVKVADLAISSEHLTGTLEANYRYDGKKGGFLDLQGKFGNADGKYAPYYYPNILGVDTLAWLDSSILSGRVENINVVIKGYLDDFPYPNDKDGQFRISARVSDGVLDYADGWPRIEGLGLDMLFHGDRMDLKVDRGRIYGGQIVAATVSIPSLDAALPVLDIRGEMQAPAADAIRYVNNSPVAESIDHFTDRMQASGAGKLQLELHVPIDNPEATRVKGGYVISNGTVVDPDLPPLDHVNGKLEFTESSLRAHNVSANIYSGPGRFSLETDKDGAINVNARGRISENGIRQIVSHPLLQQIHGATDWVGEVRLQNKQPTINVRSQLVGISSSLPLPFNKNAVDEIPFQFERRQLSDTQDTMSIVVGNIVNAKLQRSEQKGVMVVDRGVVNVGGASGDMVSQSGIAVNGKLVNLDWEQWSKLLPDNNAPNAKDSGAEISSANLNIDALDIFGRRIHDLKLDAKPANDGWQLGMQSREINGDVHWLAQGNGKISARLKTLVFPDAAPPKLSEPVEDSGPDSYPALDIVAEQFEANQKKFGKLELSANQKGGDWIIDKLNISNKDSNMRVNGEWRSWRHRPDTRINLDWTVDDMGKTLDRFGYPGTIKGGSGTLKGQLRWPGSPHEFSLATLSGKMQLETGKGQFLKIQPGVGRLLGILSLQSLPRRLLLDFRDVFSDGFGFNKITANVHIDRGVMRSDDFQMEGPAANVAINGETDLDKETLKLHVKVEPSISDSLSVAAFAGGPVAGAAAIVASKLLKDPLNKLAAYEYDIVGTWDDPQEKDGDKKDAEKKAPDGPAIVR